MHMKLTHEPMSGWSTVAFRWQARSSQRAPWWGQTSVTGLPQPRADRRSRGSATTARSWSFGWTKNSSASID